MKYMTPDLIARSQSADDRVAEDVLAEWDRACRQYNEHLQAIGPQLTESVRYFLDSFCLHDARVLGRGRTLGAKQEDRLFSILLELDQPRDRWLLLEYQLVGEPTFIRHEELSDGKGPLVWLYDEISVADAAAPTFLHTILFTGGRELQLTFSNLRLERFLLAAPHGGAKPDQPDEKDEMEELLLS